MCGILSFTPLDLVDLFFDFEGFQVVELWFVRLEFGIKFVFTAFFLRKASVSLERARLATDDDRLSCYHRMQTALTISLRSNSTTRPPLSPVAR
jgi:hypothetical protein